MSAKFPRGGSRTFFSSKSICVDVLVHSIENGGKQKSKNTLRVEINQFSDG